MLREINKDENNIEQCVADYRLQTLIKAFENVYAPRYSFISYSNINL